MGFLPCPLPCQSKKKSSDIDHDQTQSRHLSSDSSSSLSLSSRSFSSLYSQPSLPSIPSLSISSSQFDQHLSNTFHHCLATLTSHSSYVFFLSLAGKHLYSGSSNGEIVVLDNYSKENIVCQSGSAVKSIVIMGDKIFSAHQDHRIRIHHIDTVSALALSKDGSLLYSASWDRTFKVWRTSDFKCLESVWNAHDDAINSIVISNNGHVYTGSADKKIKIWNKQQVSNNKHTLVSTLEKHKSAVNALALSEDGSVLYSGACDRSIIVWEKDSDSGSNSMVVSGALRGHKKSILCLAVVSDLVCSGSADKTVRIWKKGFGKSYSCLAVFEGHKGPVKCLTAGLDSKKDDNSCSGNSYLVYSGSLDCDVKVWKLWVPNYL
ncbi:hypothetical protein RND71_010491 [Anisodus tanguticus]|uniref:Uncharacterized protein n=1 Tax=Anisodus tanguticus TaxID=243964 RepID=A0AAE1SLR5_9SOLA|nr:hypothetical protein RND71_010491 [Anisodus tanguticus]